jgi:hypothetical protein
MRFIAKNSHARRFDQNLITKKMKNLQIVSFYVTLS